MIARLLLVLLLHFVSAPVFALGSVSPGYWYSDSSTGAQSQCGVSQSCGDSYGSAADQTAAKVKAQHDVTYGCAGAVTVEVDQAYPNAAPPQTRYVMFGQDDCPGGWPTPPERANVGYFTVFQRGLVCPANSSGSGGSCSCNAGWQPSSGGGACQEECTPGRVADGGWFDVGTSATGRPQTLGCTAQCEVIYDGYSVSASSLVNGVKHYFAKGQYIVTGAACDSGDAPPGASDPGTGNGPPDPTCAAGQALGKVNGLDVCVNQGNGQPSGPGSGGSGSGSSSTTTTTQNPGGGSTTTTTTEDTWTNGDGSQGGSTTTTVVTCDADGNCESNEVEEGDTKPEDQTECEREPDKLGCAELGELDEQPPLTNVAVPSSISPDSGWMTSGSCPADESIALSFGTVVLPWSKLCTFATGIRPFVVGFAWFSGALIFLGLSRKA